MLFNSPGFLAFFAVLVPLLYLAADRYRWALLLAASVFFYATFRVEYLALLLGVWLVAYGAGRAIGASENGVARRAWLTTAIIAVIGTLAVAKSFPRAGLTSVVGLSFYSLSAVSYLIDVFRRELPPERHGGYLALYLAFFPKLLAGPIERARPFLQTLRVPVTFSSERVTSGLQLMLWGLFKKVVIADRLAVFVDAAYRQPSFASPADLVIATYFFAFQIYCDFSGYTDMAIGAAKVLGYDLMENFRRPYLSVSAAEFWSRRWHVSLASWFRDYLYIPLGGSRVSRVRHALNIMIVFLASGIWHGVNWTFIVWGGLNGVYVIASTMLVRGGADAAGERRSRSSLSVVLRSLGTFHLILITWIFFRAASLSDAVTIMTRTAAALPVLPTLLRVRLMTPEILLGLALIGVLMGVEFVDERKSVWERLRLRPVVVRWAAYYALLLGLVVLGTWNLRQFVYMQF